MFSILWFAMTTLFYYYIGNSLERQWGTPRFTVFYGLGVVLNILVGFLMGGTSMYYINMSMFFAFATLYPDLQVLLYGILPLKVKWLAWIDAALFALDSAMVKLCTGTYVGDGDESRTVSVPFPPRAVFLCTQYGETYRDIGSGHVYGGLALAGHPLRHKNCDALVISDTGFTVYQYSIDNLSAIQMNLDGVTYQYIAVG